MQMLRMADNSRGAIELLIVTPNTEGFNCITDEVHEASYVKFSLSHADTVKKTKEFVNLDNYDLIILDLSLRDSFRGDTIWAINRLNPAIPIVVISDSEDSIAFYGMGASLCLRKGKYSSLVAELCYVLLSGGKYRLNRGEEERTNVQ